MREPITVETLYGTYTIEISKPSYCPHCGKGIDPKILGEFIEDTKFVQFLYVAMKCPICEEVFWTKYLIRTSNRYSFELDRNGEYIKTIGGNGLTRKFSKEIEDLSPDFVQVYNDAYKAEQAGYTNVVGLGYRLAFEKLIKDFCIKENSANANDIKKKPLAACINMCNLSQATIDTMNRTAWLGNDFSHYESKHQNFDIDDLKKLVDICVGDIETDIRRKHYINNIQPK